MSRQGSLFAGLKKFTSRNENDGDSVYSDKKRQPSVSSYSSSNSQVPHSLSVNSLDTNMSYAQSPPSPSSNGKAGFGNYTFTHKEINALTDLKPIPTVRSQTPGSPSHKKNSRLQRGSVSSSHISSPSSLSNSSSLNNFTNGNHGLSNGHNGVFELKMPEDENVIEEQFRKLMSKRDFQNLPKKAKDQMLLYSSQKKWMLIYQDALDEHKKKERSGEGSGAVNPEFYVQRLVDKTITIQQLANLWVSLRTEPVDWVRVFIKSQGEIAIFNTLNQLHTRSRHQIMSAEEILEREQQLLKCVKSILNIDEGANLAIKSQQAIPIISYALLSPRLATRKLVTEMLTFFVHWLPPDGYNQVLKTFDNLSFDNIYTTTKGMEKFNVNGKKRDKNSLNRNAKPRRFEEWLQMINETLDGRGKMGSLVGASEEFKSGQNGENQLLDYIYDTMLLVNSIASGNTKANDDANEFRHRVHIQAQLRTAGLNKLFKRFRELGSDIIDDKIREFEDQAALDMDSLVRADRASKNVNLNDPVELTNQMWHKIKGSDAEGSFLSTMQHLFLTQADPFKSDNAKELDKSFRLMDGIISGISMHNTSADENTQMNIAIQKLYSKMQSDDIARKAVQELKAYRKKAEEATAERDEIAKQLSIGANGMLEKLAKELKEQEIVLQRQRRMNDQLTHELEDLKKQHITEKQNHELEMREIFVSYGNKDPEMRKQVLQSILEKLPEKTIDTRKQSKSLNKTVMTNTRLHDLRQKMDDLGREALKLENTEFEDRRYITSPTTAFENSPVLRQAIPDARADYERLQRLREKLNMLQHDSNDVIKINGEYILENRKRNCLDRLDELKSDFQITLNAINNADLSPELQSKLLQEITDMQEMKLRLAEKLKDLDEKESNKAIDELEQKYIGGKVEQAKVDVVSNNNEIIAAKSETMGKMKGVLEGLLGKGENKDASDNESDLDSADESEKQQPGATMGLGLQTNKRSTEKSVKDSSEKPSVPESAAAEVAAPPPPPAPPLPEGGLLTSPPPPPAPPLPSIFSPSSTPRNPPPPPPPLPGVLSPLSPKLMSPKEGTFGFSDYNDAFVNYPRPKRKLKQLHWDKLENTENSIWDGVSDETLAVDLSKKGIFDEMEVMFAAREVKKFNTEKAAGKDKVTFLPRDINQQFSINLYALSSLSDEEAVMKVLLCDESILENTNALEFLSKRDIVEVPNNLARQLEPYSTDCTDRSEKKPDKDPNELHRADRLYLELIYNLQHYWPARMRALLMVTSFEKDYSILVQKLQQVDDAAEAISNSENTRYMFNVILAFGNYMNDAGKQAKGFKLSTLQRLSFMKDDKNSMTFLHYVEKIVRETYPEFAKFQDDLKPALSVSKLSLEILEADCRDYVKTIRAVDTSLEIGSLSDSELFHPKDRVLQVVLPKMPDARRKADLLEEQAKIIFSGLDRIMTLFGENPSDPFAKNSFFGKFANFVAEYQKANKENLKREEELKSYENRKMALESATKKQDTYSEKESGGENVMDNLLAKLKQVGPAKGDPASARRKALARRKILEARKNNADLDDTLDDSIQEETEVDESRDTIDASTSEDILPSSLSSLSPPSTATSTMKTGVNSSDNSSTGDLSTENAAEETEEEEISVRARQLLKTLRSGSEGSPTPNSNGLTAAQQLRQQRRQQRRNASESVQPKPQQGSSQEEAQEN